MEMHRLDYLPHLRQMYEAREGGDATKLQAKGRKKLRKEVDYNLRKEKYLEMHKFQEHLREEQEQTQVRCCALHRSRVENLLAFPPTCTIRGTCSSTSCSSWTGPTAWSRTLRGACCARGTSLEGMRSLA